MPRGEFLPGLMGGLGEGGSVGLQNMMALQRALIAAGQMGLMKKPMFKGRQRMPEGFVGETAPAPEYVGERYMRRPEGGGDLRNVMGLAPGMEQIPGQEGMWGMPAGERTMLGPIGEGNIDLQIKKARLAGMLQDPEKWASEMAHKEAKSKSVDVMGVTQPGIYNDAYTAAYDKYRMLVGLLGEGGLPGAGEGEGAGRIKKPVEGALTEATGGEFWEDAKIDAEIIASAPQEVHATMIETLRENEGNDYATAVSQLLNEQLRANMPGEVPGPGQLAPGGRMPGGGRPSGFTGEFNMLKDFVMPPYGRGR